MMTGRLFDMLIKEKNPQKTDNKLNLPLNIILSLYVTL